MFDIVNDSGPIYQETIMGRWPVEPWNTFSNVVILFSLFYWSYHVYKNPKQHLFMAICIPFIYLGVFGATMYHSTRSHEVWLLMDWVPIAVLSIATSIYFMIKVRLHWAIQPAVVLSPFFIPYLFYITIDIPEVYISMLSYGMNALMILGPIYIYLRATNFNNWHIIGLSVLSIFLGIMFRTMDKGVGAELFPMGTHWLWHAFSGLSVYFLMEYVYKMNNQKEVFSEAMK